MIKSLSKFRKGLSSSMLIIFMTNYWGHDLYATPGGPSQPEFSAFKPISSSDMVDKFSGNFSYNIPLFDIGGYPVNMFYDGSISNDVEASWVGLGWNLNTGSINRNKRGLPDDYKGEELEKFIKKDNVSRWGVSPGGHIQIANMLGFGVKGGIYYSSLTGFGTEASFGKSLGIPIINKGGMNLNLGLSENTSSSSEGGVTNSFNIGVSAGKSFSLTDRVSGGLTLGASYGETTNSRQGLLQTGFKVSMDAKATVSNHSSKERKTQMEKYDKLTTKEDKQKFMKDQSEDSPEDNDRSFSSRLGGVGFTRSYIDPTFTPTMEIPYKTISFTLNLKGGLHGCFLDGGVTLDGYATIQKIANNNLKSKGFGYMYSDYAKDVSDRLMDFNREKDVAYHVKAPNLAIPIQTYDLFSINQHQNGGQFRAFRNDVGLLLDKDVTTEKDDYNLSLEGHGGVGFELGGTIEIVNAETKTFPIIEDQLKPYDFVRDANGNPVKEKFFFRKSNEVEMVDLSFQSKTNGITASNLQLMDNGLRSGTLESKSGNFLNTLNLQKFYEEDNNIVPSNGGRFYRPNKRNTYISFLDAMNRAKYGMQKQILSYSTEPTQGFLHKTALNLGNNENLISEFTVVNPDGMKYYYGIPVMNTTQEEYSFSLAPRNPLLVNGKYTGLVKLDPNELNNGPAEDASYDGYYCKESQPKYAHSWLLSGIYSPDYQDVLNDGITDDDRGNAIKFNYTNKGEFGWRNPIHPNHSSTEEVALHNKGVEFISSDDKAIVNYGKREEWYNHSIESKTMIAYFFTSKRLDANSLDKNGRKINGQAKEKLDEIAIYSKSEIGNLLKDYPNLTLGQLKAMATPIKTINFIYDYSLCPNNPNNSGVAVSPVNINVKKGKLTLKRIEFKGGKNSTNYSYKFDYGDINSPIDNPEYNAKNVDRWGNHKSMSNNDLFAPGQNVHNDAFPYVVQDKDLNDPLKLQNNINDKNARAWTLKTITLPSGGTIDVDYESHDYSYVQHKRTARMYRLVGIGTTEKDILGKTSLYQATKSINSATSLFQVTESNNFLFFETNLPAGTYTQKDIYDAFFNDDINDRADNKYLFYKVRIKLDGGQNKYENLPGYLEIEKDNQGIYQMGAHKSASSSGKLVVWIKIKPVKFTVKATTGAGLMPGFDILTSKLSNLLSKDIYLNPIARNSWQFIMERIPELAWDGYSLGKDADPFDIITSLLGNVGKIFTGERQFEMQAIDRGLAKDILLDGNSYVRAYIPEKTKFGGNGSRVRKITISDNWDQLVNVNNPDIKPERGVYTYEYDYTSTDERGQKISSGVATYEPLIGGEENPWRQPVFYEGQMGPGGPTSVESIEKPFGETLFPSPHVGYSSIKVYSNREKAAILNTGNGFKQYEYYTAKDFPVSSEHTEINDKTLKRDKPSFTFDIFGFGSNWDHTSVSQGYSVILNDMHGKLRSEKYYKHGEDKVPLNSTIYHYKNDTKLPMIDDKGIISDKEVGIQSEMYIDNRHQVSKTSSKNISPGGGLELCIPPFPIGWGMVMGGYTTMETSVKMLSTCKVISKSFPQYKVEANNEGAVITTEDLLWDQRTGNVVLSKVNNEYKDKSYYKLNIPAYWNYKNLGHVYPTADMKLDMVLVNGTASGDLSIDNTTGKVFNTAKYLSDGDEVFIEEKTTSGALTTVGTGKHHYISEIKESSSGSIMAFFVDLMGKALVPNNTGTNNYRVTLLRSANKNQIEAAGVSLTTMTDPRDATTLKANIFNVLDGSAVEYTDRWKWIPKNSEILDASGNAVLSYVKNPVLHGVKGDWKPIKSYVVVGNRAGFTNTNENPNLANDALLIDNPTTNLAGKGVNIPYNNLGGFVNSNGSWNSQSEATLFDSKGNLVEDVVKLSKFDLIEHGANAIPYCACSFDFDNNPPASGEVYRRISHNSPAGCNQICFTMACNSPMVSCCRNIILILKIYDPLNRLVDTKTMTNIWEWGSRKEKVHCWFDVRIPAGGRAAIQEIDNCLGRNYEFDAYDSKLITEDYIRCPPGTICYSELTPTTSKFGYNRSLPVIVAHNAEYKEIDFCSFEDLDFELPKATGSGSNPESQYDGIVPKAWVGLSAWGSHTGKTAYATMGGSATFAINIDNNTNSNSGFVKEVSNHLVSISSKDYTSPTFSLKLNKKYKLKVWIKMDEFAGFSPITVQLKDKSGGIIATSSAGQYLTNPIEGWRLYEIEIPNITSSTNKVFISMNGISAGNSLVPVVFDDLRITPADATAKSFVYDDKTMRLISELDENHFATFYDYDDAGNLIRVRKETERGIVTLKEGNFSYQKIK